MKDKSAILIEALKQGAVLVKEYKDFEKEEYILLHFYKDYPPRLELRGWGAAIGTGADRIVDIVNNPQNWEILEDGDFERVDYPFIKDQMKERLNGKTFKH